MRRILTGLVLILMLTGGAAAGPRNEGVALWEEGHAAFKRGDYATALHLWRPLAEQGEAVVQMLLGGMYQEGRSVPIDYAEAVKWYRLAAEQGQAVAQVNLGVTYFFGHQGVPQDYAEALKWYRLAAEQGEVRAQRLLGVIYHQGQGAPQDYAEALK